MTTKLFSIPKTSANLNQLISLLKIRLPKSAQLYNITRSYLDSRLNGGAITNIDFLTSKGLGNPEEDVKSALIVILQTRKFLNSLVVTISQPEIVPDEMVKAFEEFIPWDKNLLFAGIDKDFIHHVIQSSKFKGTCPEVDENYFFSVPLDQMRTINENSKSLDDIQVRELTPKDAEIVAKYWKFTSEGTIPQMEDVIRNIGSIGVFTPESETPVSWVIGAHHGILSSLHTLDPYRRRGYAEITLRAIAQQMHTKGLIPIATVQMPNLSAKALMPKAGYTYSHQVVWIDYEPNSVS